MLVHVRRRESVPEARKGCRVKALSLWNPWAMLMAVGEKTVETRGWATSYRGLLAIHAAQKRSAELRALMDEEPFKGALENHGIKPGAAQYDYPHGAVVAVVHLDVCVATDIWVPSILERPFGNYEPGRYAWRTSGLQRLLAPVLCRGRQRLFDLPADVERMVREQIEAAWTSGSVGGST